MAAKQKRVYKRLKITAQDRKTEIWVSDEDGHLVQKETGRMDTSLLPGRYRVRFGLGSPDREFELLDDVEIHESS